ncbi:hypothetical protein [Streptomyces sp. NEAU-NA10]|uniref:hypothetical protein n=1 Tax=Streptomyces sp. NEAU-NA10 TaxID=3416050 RepID=UPI003CC654A4
MSKAEARMQWACADPARLGRRRHGVQVLASPTPSGLPPGMCDELPPAYQDTPAGLGAQRLPQVEECRLSLVRLF